GTEYLGDSTDTGHDHRDGSRSRFKHDVGQGLRAARYNQHASTLKSLPRVDSATKFDLRGKPAFFHFGAIGGGVGSITKQDRALSALFTDQLGHRIDQKIDALELPKLADENDISSVGI